MSTGLLLDHFVLFGFFALVFFAALSDAASYRIPDGASIGVAALFPLHAILSPTPVDWVGSLVVAGIVFAAGFAMFARGWMGGGDVKLLSAAALWAGSSLILPQLILMAFAGGLLAAGFLLVHAVRHGPARADAVTAAAPKVPYGIAIAAGAGYSGVKLLLG